jgi:prepilin-type N-terminal cleavage/methylation domain-containing protein
MRKIFGRLGVSLRSKKGFTLIESLVGIAVFMIMAVSVYQAYTANLNAVRVSRLKITATALANEQFEIIRNLPYQDVGVVGSIPNGKIPRTQNLIRDNTEFVVETTIRNIDDPFDGTIGGSPNDLSPADYRLAELEISCPSCSNFTPLKFTTQVGPRNLESASTNGALFVQVFDAAGQAVAGANVHIENNQTTPAIVIDDTTNNNGLLQVVDAPPGAGAYEITVSKSGYSSDRTYPSGAPENPNPLKPHATVALQQLTQISFAIDRTSTLDVSSITNTCSPVPSIDFSLAGSKLVGTDPDVLKYSAPHITDGVGKKIISNLEWDTYNLTLTDSLYDIAGTIPLLPLVLNPSTNQDFKIIVAPKDPRSILITVKDASTQLPLSGATVRLQGAGYDASLTTGRGFLSQTDWSGGAGQEDFIDPARYFSSDGNIEKNNPAGEIRLRKVFYNYEPSGYLISSTFDTGSASNFHQILWQPQSQPPDTGPDSVRFQIATNNDKATWDFLGPDGTANTYYTIANQDIHTLHNGDRYLRYKVFLQTASTTWTPTVSDVSFTFTSSCVPSGQVLFSGLSAGDYTLTVSRAGYQTFNDTVSVSSPWQQRDVVLSP